MASTSTTRKATPPPTESFATLEGVNRPTPLTSSGAAVANTTPNSTLEIRLPTAQKHSLTPPKGTDRGLSPRTASALPLTGAAAMAELKRRSKAQSNGVDDPRQTSPNPAVQAMHSLMGSGGMSRPTDAPAADKLSEPLRRAAEKISVPTTVAEHNESEQVSPVSLASFGTAESAGSGMTATANDHNPQFVAEPAQMTDGGSYAQNNGHHANHLAVQEQDGSKAFSYPGPPSDQQDGGPSRGMSLPGYGQGGPKSPASTSKRHKCPYCSTDFTRHHNLKSHLLTHSQEKPYVCQTCQARFRRLHDLKRHTKLHTGERPHKCDKCGRQFARGDALARHNKGPGGCAGRRSSFGGDDDYDGEGMEGVEYDGDDQDDGQSSRRISEPNRKRQHLETSQDSNREVYRQHSSTYPPAPTARNMQQGQGSMGPPQVVHPGSSSTATSPREMPGHSPAPGSYYSQGQVFAEPGMMTSSPKPLSPGQAHHDQHRLSVDNSAVLGRNRSTSLTTQFQQAHFGRGSIPSSGRSPPPPPMQFGGQSQQTQSHVTLPPLSASSQTPAQQPPRTSGIQSNPPMTSGPPLLPNLHLPSQLGGQGPGSYSGSQNLPSNQTQASQPGSHSSHGRSSGSSMRDLVGGSGGGSVASGGGGGGGGGGTGSMGEADLWAYVRQLEGRVSRMTEEYELRISRLQSEVIELRGQVQGGGGGGSYSSEMGGQQRGGGY